MLDIALVVKSFKPDAHLVAGLVASARRFNTEQIPLIVAVPDAETGLFKVLLNDDSLTIVGDSEFGAPLITEKINDFNVGYINQQMIKLSVHKLGLAHNYVVLDSDTYFIRTFGRSDFLDESGRAFTVLTQDKDQAADPGYAKFQSLRMPMVNTIGDYFSLPSYARATCHNNAVFSSSVLERFEEWRRDKGLSLVDLMTMAPVEYSWYNFFLRSNFPEEVVQVEPIVRVLHTRSEFRSIVRQGMTTSTLASAYVGICINSTWAGRRQDRYRRQLERGSLFANLRVRADQSMYSWAEKLGFARAEMKRRLQRR